MGENMPVETGEVIRRRREALGMSQTQLAERLGTDRRQIQRWESGEREPGLATARQIAETLGITLAELAGEPSQRIDMTGDWWACWQSWKEGVEVFNAHQVSCDQRGDDVDVAAVTRGTTVEDGGYLWRGAMRLWDNEILMGWYVASEQAIRSKGTMYFTLHQHGQTATGRWVGLSYDGDLVTGWAAMAKTEDGVKRLMDELITRPVTPGG
jgi:transcriptional regulator with XRE-family HTH domain